MKPIFTAIWFGMLLVALTGCVVVTPQANTSTTQTDSSKSASSTTTEVTDSAPIQQPQDAAKMDDKPKAEGISEAATAPEAAGNSQVADNSPPAEIGPTAEQLQILANLADKGPAPELHNEVFLNSETLRLADLRGKVVVVDFWTYG